MKRALKNVSRLLLISLFIAPIIFLTNKTTSASDNVTWFDNTKEPSLITSYPLSRDSYSSVVEENYQPDCKQSIELTRDFIPSWALWRQSINACWTSTPIGRFSAGSGQYFISSGDYIAGNFTNIPSSASIRPTTSSVHYLETKGGSSRYNQVLYHPWVVTSRHATGSVSHELKYEDVFRLKGESGNNISFGSNYINYSRNGRYLLGTVGSHAMIRVDMETKKILNFGLPVPLGAGWNPFMAISITDDGRYAVATVTAGRGGQWMRLYDLSSCAGGEYDYVANQHANCNYIDLTDYLSRTIPDFHRFGMAKFGDNDTLFFYHFPEDPGQPLQRYILRAQNAKDRTNSYLAMGDSFASGEGAGSYFMGTDYGEKLNNCHLSQISYPYIIGAHLGMDSVHSVACSGAKKHNIESNLVENDRLDKEPRRNQYLSQDALLDKGLELDSRLLDWFPGYRLQSSFLKSGAPDAVTISIIGNDIGFGEKIKSCLMPTTCYDSFEDRLEILREVRSKFDDLVETYEALLHKSGESSKIYVIGYPKIGYGAGNCAVNVFLNSTELEFAELLVVELNKVIRAAADKAGVFYVDVEDSLVGHRFCEDESHLVAMNGLTLGNDKFAIVGNESYHPNILGQKLLAQAIMQKTENFTVENPSPSSDASAPTDEEGLLFLKRPRVNRPLYTTRYNSEFSEDLLLKNGSSLISVEASIDARYQPFSLVGIYIYSEPTLLATVQAGADGSVSAEMTIPDSVEPGFHTLHVFGKDLLGNPIDTYKTVYVAHSEEDKNGNDVIDAEEPCGVFEASGLDVDEDGIDDACDPLIGLPPLGIKEVMQDKTSEETDDTTVANEADSAEQTSNATTGLYAYSEAEEILGIDSSDKLVPVQINNERGNTANSGGYVFWLIGTLSLLLFIYFAGLRYSKR